VSGYSRLLGGWKQTATFAVTDGVAGRVRDAARSLPSTCTPFRTSGWVSVPLSLSQPWTDRLLEVKVGRRYHQPALSHDHSEHQSRNSSPTDVGYRKPIESSSYFQIRHRSHSNPRLKIVPQSNCINVVPALTQSQNTPLRPYQVSFTTNPKPGRAKQQKRNK
jgi:hypothetical protein